MPFPIPPVGPSLLMSASGASTQEVSRSPGFTPRSRSLPAPADSGLFNDMHRREVCSLAPPTAPSQALHRLARVLILRTLACTVSETCLLDRVEARLLRECAIHDATPAALLLRALAPGQSGKGKGSS